MLIIFIKCCSVYYFVMELESILRLYDSIHPVPLDDAGKNTDCRDGFYELLFQANEEELLRDLAENQARLLVKFYIKGYLRGKLW
jgi:hypothetical protein